MSQAISASNPTAAASAATNRPTFILVDGHSLAFRSYFAFAKGRDGGLRTKTGIPTSVCFGFLKSLLEVMASQQPEAMAIAFDLGLPTFRHEADDTYKADRPGTPEDFIPDLKNLHELLAGFNVPILTAPGYEADDVLGTLAQRASAAGYQVKILSGDRDLFQLIDPEKAISVLYLSSTFIQQRSNNNGPTEFGPEQVKEKLGISPAQVVDYKALCGDKSDNIPGVRGIGEKTAVQLLSQLNSLDEIYTSLEQIKGATKKKLEEGKDAAYHSQHLARLVLDVPLEVDLENCKLTGFDGAILQPILEKLEFKQFLGKIDKLQQQFGGVVDSSQADDFSETSGAAIAEAIAVPSQEPELESDDLWFFSAADTEASQEQKAPSQITPQIIDTPDKLTELVQRLQRCTDPKTPVAWDTETTDLEPRDAQLVGLGCCWGELDAVAYIPTGHAAGNNLDLNMVLAALRPILESDRYPKTLQNAKFDRLALQCQGIQLAGVVFDPMLASYVLDPDKSHNLTDLAIAYLGLTLRSYVDLVPKGQKISDIDIPAVADYCGMQVYATFMLVPKLRAELEKFPDLHQLLLDVEQPLEPVLAAMEYAGIRIDQAYLKKLSNDLEKQLAALEEKAYSVAGEKFNLGSPKQLSELLFEKLKLDRKKSRKIQTGYSTDAATLEKLQGDHPIIDAILEYRTLAKLKSTYVDALPALVRPDTQRVHTDFNQAITSTGRLSSSNPNLQNIPIRTAFSRQIRKAFIPDSGWLMVAADYSQIELRILAHLCQEPILVEAYQGNEDIHTVTARLLFEKDIVTPDERRLAKTINFGVIYGMGPQRFARETGMSTSIGKTFIEKFNQQYPKVFQYLQQMQQEAIARGYVRTILGRRRYFNFTSDRLRRLYKSKPEEINLDSIKGLNAYDAGLLRAAANAPIQGSSADIIKLAMVKLHGVLQNYQARLLLQVHDELVFEVPPNEWEELQPRIKATMESALENTNIEFGVPLVVDVRAGQNWMETK